MKTKQDLTVNIAGYEMRAQHGSEMINLNDVLKAGNDFRVASGMRPYDRVRDVLQMQGVAEYVMVVEEKLIERALSGDYPLTEAEDTRLQSNSNWAASHTLEFDEQGKAKYPKNMLAIKKRRGRYGGTWVHVKVAIRVGIEIEPHFADHVIEVFIENQLLKKRDDGGEAYKSLMDAVRDHLNPDRFDYARISKFMGRAVFYDLPTYQMDMKHIWNSPFATPYRQSLREEMCMAISYMIKFGQVKDIQGLLRVILDFKHNYQRMNPRTVDGEVIKR